MAETRIGGATFEGLQRALLSLAEQLERLLTVAEQHDRDLERLTGRLDELEHAIGDRRAT
jgi:hypothetical protein